MAIGPGSRLGPYEVTGLLGEGGMGKVWRAHHTALKRDDALKVLPDAFASDSDRLARFQREAQVLASLNHPNIAHVYGLEHADGVQALVMELVEGPTLADRIAHGPIPVDEALPIAKQIAEALEAAHEQSIIHRDLKPANIKVRPDGTVKVLDFGLAKALEPMTVGGTHATASPTITSPAMMTGVGVLLGTAAYMSPEQAKGRPADKRSDVWAFGCVLYEMLAGTRPFEGEDVSDVLAEVIKGSVAWNALPSATPLSIRRLLRRCLTKDRRNRLSDAGAARLEIEEGIAELETLAPPSPPVQATRSGWQRVWPIAAAALAGAVAVAFVAWVMAIGAPREAAQRLLPIKVTSELGTSASLTPNVGGNLALSPDGSTLAFVGNLNPDLVTSPSLLFVRRLDELAATALAGTDGASAPFFSPDGQWIAFFAEGKLRKVATSGGAVVTLCDARVGRGGSWTSDGNAIVFQPAATGGLGSNGLAFRVAAAGGQPEPVTSRREGELVHRWPQVLPGDRGVLYTANSTVGSNSDANLVVQPLPTGEPKVVHRGGYFGRYLASGHLVYFRDATLFAAPFDLDRLELTGPPVPVVEDIMSNLASGGGQLAVSDSGILVYLPGEAAAGANLAPVHWMDRSGKRTPLRSVPAIWGDPRFSPDGRRLALTVADGRQVDLWVYEWDRDILTRLTAGGMNHVSPVWAADGSRIVFASGSGAERVLNLYWLRADGAGETRRLAESPMAQIPNDVHPSGRFLVYREGTPSGTRSITASGASQENLMILPLEGNDAAGWKAGKPTLFLGGPFLKMHARFSPDGRWLAYASNESGQFEVYVRPFPGPGGRWQISNGGGVAPMWSRSGRELFYGALDDPTLTESQLMVVPYSVEGDSFRSEKPQALSDASRFRTPPLTVGGIIDLHPDSRRFAVAPLPAALGEEAKQNKLVFVFNFFDELRRVAPPAN